MSSSLLVRLVPVLFALAAVSAIASSASGQVADASTVTAANLVEHERYWPFRVALASAWQPPGRETPLSAGSTGVLIRVENESAARIDFATQGKFAVPIDQTDLVANANRIRRGELAKEQPNFVHAIATRLIDAGSDPMTGFRPDLVAEHAGFLCVFADPSARGFEKLAAALRPLSERHRVLTILFPQGSHSDAAVRKRLRDLEWTVPFVYDFLAEPYTRTLLAEGTALPALLLQTGEGRLIHQGAARPGAVDELTAALDAAFSGRATR